MMKIINEDGTPVIYFGAYKFKDKKDRKVKIINIEEMSMVAGFKVTDLVIRKSLNTNNKMLFGAVVPQHVIKKLKKKIDDEVNMRRGKTKSKSKIIKPPDVILDRSGKPIKNEKS